MTLIVAAAADTNFAQDYGNLIATILLLFVTGWYAFLTKRLADSAKESAQSAKDAAEASQAAVLIAESGVDVRFSLWPSYSVVEPDTERGPDQIRTGFGGVMLHCEGATVFVHGLTLDGVTVPGKRKGVIGMGLTYGEELSEVSRGDAIHEPSQLPLRLHRDETIFFSRKGVTQDDPDDVIAIKATVRYSLDGHGDGRPLHVQTWMNRDDGGSYL